MLLRLALVVFSAMLVVRVAITARLEAKAGIREPRLVVMAEPALPVAAAALVLLAGMDVIELGRYVVLAIGLLLAADGVARWGVVRSRRRR